MTNKSQTTNSDNSDVYSRAISAISNMFLKTIDESPPQVKLLACICGVIFFLSLITAAAFNASNQYNFAFYSYLSTLFFFAIFIIIFLGYHKSSLRTNIYTIWTRLVPRMPYSENSMKILSEELNNIRNEAFMFLSCNTENNTIDQENIRANVFLPDYTAAEPGDVCTLHMPHLLKVNMEGHPDENIKFRPRQGITGQVFITEESSFVKTKTDDAGVSVFDGSYELTENQEEQVHPRLRWIVSIPIRIKNNEHRRAAGVLNIDGLDCNFSDDILNMLGYILLEKTAGFADKLSVLPVVKTIIGWEGG